MKMIKLFLVFLVGLGLGISSVNASAAALSDVERRALAELKAAEKIAKAQQKMVKKRAKLCRKAMSKIRAFEAKGRTVPQSIFDIANTNCPRGENGQLLDVDEDGNPILDELGSLLPAVGPTVSPLAQTQNNLIGGLNVVAPADVPEPGTLALLGIGLAGIGWRLRQKQALR